MFNKSYFFFLKDYSFFLESVRYYKKEKVLKIYYTINTINVLQ